MDRQESQEDPSSVPAMLHDILGDASNLRARAATYAEDALGRHGAQLQGASGETQPSRRSEDANLARGIEYLGHETATPGNTSTPRRQGQQIIINEIADSLLEAIKERAQQRRPRAMDISLWKYHGTEQEDPAKFLQRMDDYLENQEVTDETEKVHIFGNQMGGQAATWFRAYVNLVSTYNEIRAFFIDKFDSPEERALALAKFYGDQQEPREPVASFLARKRMYKARLLPYNDFTDVEPILTNQLVPEIRSRLRNTKITQWEDYIKITTRIERDIKDIAKSHKIPSQPQPEKARNTVQTTNNTRPADNPAKPPSPCRFCQEWHYQNTCPQNPYRPGNGARGVPPSGPAAQ